METIINNSLTSEEHDVVEKFFDAYEDKNEIVADSYSEEYHVLPFEGAKVAFQPHDYSWKRLDFCKRIFIKEKLYNVHLNMWRECTSKRDPKSMTLHSFSISTPEKCHLFDFPSSGITSQRLLYRVLDIFDERKIISPEQAYFERLYNVNKIPELINQKEWKTLSDGIDDISPLADQLFIMGEPIVNKEGHKIHFGTILYQLIRYRERNKKLLSEIDLIELDKLIYKLRKTELLELGLTDQLGTSLIWPSSGILDPCKRKEGYRTSELFSVENGRLADEEQVLKKVIKPFEDK